MPKFHRQVCEVCNEPLIDISELPPDIRDQIYVPGTDDIGYEVIFEKEPEDEPSQVIELKVD